VIRRLLLTATAPVVTVMAVGPVVDRLARRLADAPRRLPEEAGMAAALDLLGGEVVRLRARDGLRLTGRWLAAEPAAAGGRSVAATGGAPKQPGPPDAPHPEGTGAEDGTPARPWVPDPREAILLLHGYSGSVTPDLLDLAPFLRRTAGVLGLDFRGHGGSDDAPTTFGLNEVEDVAGALTWLGERGIARVALVGSSMGGITAIASVAVLGDGRLPAADLDPDAPAAPGPPPRPRVVAVVADSVAPELSVTVASRMGIPFGRRVAERAFARMARHVGGDPRRTQPIAVIGLLEDLPLLLIHGDADRTVPIRDARRLAAIAPPGSRHLVVPGADHGDGHRIDPAAYEAAVTDLLQGAFSAGRG
jgi:pimeloyl-ACP methyl ester carboxylesterase